MSIKELMNCDNCGSKTSTKKLRLFHYKHCGLPNVYLGNVVVIECKKCRSQIPIIPKVLELYETLARAIGLKKGALTGLEARFLRKQLGLTAKAWADYLRVDVSALSRWENGKTPIGPQSDSLIRLMYFRILEEREGQRVEESVSESIASVSSKKEPDSNVFVNMNNPSVFSFRSTRELIAA